MISGSDGNFEHLNDITFNCRFLYYTNISNNVHPNKMVQVPTTQTHLQKTSIGEAWWDPMWPSPSVALGGVGNL